MSLAKNAWFIMGYAALGMICSAEETTVRLRADHWMPFNGAPDAEKPGYVIEIVRAIFVPQGVGVDYATMSWETTLKAVREGEVDGAIGTNALEGADLLLGAEPIGRPKVGLFICKDSLWKYENLQSLNKIKVGAIAGYSYWESFDTYIKNHIGKNIVLFQGDNPLADALTKLNAKEIDMMPETLAVFAWALKSRGIVFTDYRVAYLSEGDPIFIGFTKNDRGRRFARMMDTGLRKLRANGELAKILANYGIEDWKE